MSNTTTERIDAYYWMQSDWAYFGNPRLKKLGQDYGIKINHVPVDLSTVYMRTGGIKLQYRSKERKAYRHAEMKRFMKILDMPINLEPTHWCATGHLPSFVVIAAREQGLDVQDLSQSIMHALWAEDRDIESPDVLCSIADRCGFDGAALLVHAKDPRTERVYMANTNEAIERGVFGAPFYFFRGESFWGQDRLDMLATTVREALAGRQSPGRSDLQHA